MSKDYYVYIMTNKYNKVLYTGVTKDLARCIGEHRDGSGSGFTTRYRGDILVVGAKDQTAAGGGRYPGSPAGGSKGAAQLEVRGKEGRVSVDLNNADLGDALKQIAEQSKLNFITYGDVRGEVTAKLDKVPIEKAILTLTTSAGLVWTNPANAISALALLAEADQEMYRAKRSGRAQLCYKNLESTIVSTQERSALMTLPYKEGI